VQNAGGALTPPPGYSPESVESVTSTGILLCADVKGVANHTPIYYDHFCSSVANLSYCGIITSRCTVAVSPHMPSERECARVRACVESYGLRL